MRYVKVRKHNSHERMVEVLRGGERVADYIYDGLRREGVLI